MSKYHGEQLVAVLTVLRRARVWVCVFRSRRAVLLSAHLTMVNRREVIDPPSPNPLRWQMSMSIGSSLPVLYLLISAITQSHRQSIAAHQSRVTSVSSLESIRSARRVLFRHSLKRERQKNLMLNKKLLSHYLLTNTSDLQALPIGINDTSVHCPQLLVSPTQSTVVPQHQYASTPNDTSRVLLINTSVATPPTHLNQSFASPARAGSLAMKQQMKPVGSNMLRHYSSII